MYKWALLNCCISLYTFGGLGLHKFVLLFYTLFFLLKQVRCQKLVSDIGFKVKVTMDDILEILEVWRRSRTPFKARYWCIFITNFNVWCLTFFYLEMISFVVCNCLFFWLYTLSNASFFTTCAFSCLFFMLFNLAS